MDWAKIRDGYRGHFSANVVARLAWFGLALLFAGIFLKLSWELREDAFVDSWDKQILLWVAKHRYPYLNGSAVDVTGLGSPIVLSFFTLIGGLIFALWRDWLSCLYLVGGSAGAGLLTFLLKHFFTRPRPDLVPRLVEVSGYSYPSGHSLAGSAFYFLIMFLSWRAFTSWWHRLILLALACLLVCSIALSRIYLGAHYPSDVLSGILLGASWACLLTSLLFSPKITIL